MIKEKYTNVKWNQGEREKIVWPLVKQETERGPLLLPFLLMAHHFFGLLSPRFSLRNFAFVPLLSCISLALFIHFRAPTMPPRSHKGAENFYRFAGSARV